MIKDHPVAHIKSAHSISLVSHTDKPLEMIPCRSSKLLNARAPALPAMAHDLSFEQASENISRRSAHKTFYEADSTVFRRKYIPEGATDQIYQRHLVRDFLTDLHPLKDVRGLNIGKKYNFSRVSTATIDPDVPPLDDFVRPNDVISPRSTGYTQGHMRSLLHFDTFGPQSSRIATLGREIGLLPESPNVDRYSKKNEDRRSASASAASSRCSTSSSNNLPSFRASQSRARLAKFSREGLDMPHSLQFDEIQQLFHPSMSTSNLHHNSSAYSTSKTIGEQSKVSVGTLGYHGRAISVEDRLIAGDPFVTRTLWFKSYQQRIKDNKKEAEEQENLKKYRQDQKRVALQEKQYIRQFENRLALAKLSVK